MVAAQIQESAKETALVVEDNEHAAYLLEFMLRRAGFEVMVAGDGREASALIESSAPVDVVLLDLMLPYVSGYKLLSDIRDNRDWCHVPVIVVSAKVLESDIVRALDLGANDYVTKPFRPQELLARIRRCMADREQRSPR
jgi:DNA-binding response OmpR family regulator